MEPKMTKERYGVVHYPWKRKIDFSPLLLAIIILGLVFGIPNTGTVFAQPIPVLSVTAACDHAANGTFVITDIGASMTGNGTWTLTLNGTPIATNPFLLISGQSTNVNTAGLFGTLVLSASGGGSSGTVIASTFCNPPTLAVTATCDATGNGTFVITDIGASMTGNGTWTLTLNGTQVSTNSFLLNSGQSTNVNTSGLLGALVLSASGGGSSGTVSASTICPAVAPLATTNEAGGITTSGATLNGTVNANGESTTVTFEYGLTTSYGTTVTADQSPILGNSDTAVSKGITGLSANTTYHYRVVAASSGGTTNGGDQVFNTGSFIYLPLILR